MPELADLAHPESFAKDDHFNLNPGDQSDAISALDALAGITPAATPTPEEAAAAAKAAEAAAAAAPAADEAAKAAEAAATAKAAEEAAAAKATEEAAAAAAKAAEGTPPVKPELEVKPAAAKDDYDAVQLPPHTSDKAKDSFSFVKKMAREREGKLTAQLNEVTAKLEETTKKVSAQGKLPDEVEKELTDLRRFHLAHEVESDPTFSKFASEMEANNQAILNKLEAVGMTKENLEKIKELGGPANVDWETLLPKLPFTARTYVQGKLVDNETLADKKTAALEAAKANAAGFMKDRESREATQLIESANTHLSKLSWTSEQAIPATATPEQKATIEAGNKLARESVDRVKTYLSDRSPSRFAELAVGTAMAYKFQADAQAAEAKITTMETAHKAAIAKLQTERDTAVNSLAALKKAEIGPRGGDATNIIPPRSAPKKGEADLRDGESAFAQYEADARAAQS